MLYKIGQVDILLQANRMNRLNTASYVVHFGQVYNVIWYKDTIGTTALNETPNSLINKRLGNYLYVPIAQFPDNAS